MFVGAPGLPVCYAGKTKFWKRADWFYLEPFAWPSIFFGEMFDFFSALVGVGSCYWTSKIFCCIICICWTKRLFALALLFCLFF